MERLYEVHITDSCDPTARFKVRVYEDIQDHHHKQCYAAKDMYEEVYGMMDDAIPKANRKIEIHGVYEIWVVCESSTGSLKAKKSYTAISAEHALRIAMNDMKPADDDVMKVIGMEVLYK